MSSANKRDEEQLVQCVPNFSEGRNHNVLRGLAKAIEGTTAQLIDWSADGDHNRSVFTFIGTPLDVLEAAFAAARFAVENIDISLHDGVHPWLGALDVLPFVPITNISIDECAAIAHLAGKLISSQFNLPVFFYESASDNRITLPDVRKSAFNSLLPNLGPHTPHPSAGAVVVGARSPLIAFNVNLRGSSLATAKAIAKEVRKAYAGRVRALGLELPSRNVYQVSMNVIAPDTVSLLELVEFIASRTDVLESELIGAMLGCSAFPIIQSALKMVNLRPEQILVQSWPKSLLPDAGYETVRIGQS